MPVFLLFMQCYWLLSNSMEQSPSWEANSHSDNREIYHILWNPKVVTMFTRVHWWTCLELNGSSPHHGIVFYWYCPLVFTYTPKQPMPFLLVTKLLFAFRISLICVTCPIHPIVLNLITLITDENKLWSSTLCIFVHPPITLTPLGSNSLNFCLEHP
jgi:hypothetical protein